MMFYRCNLKVTWSDNMEELKKGMMIDGCCATSAIDSQGERLSVEGADISALENGLGRINDNHGKQFTHSIGRVTGAKKIFKAEDCEDDRQRMYWEKVKSPYIYVKGELYDDVEHPNAKAAAAIMKHLGKGDSPLSVKMSVEGAVLARKDGGILDRTKVHSVALTFTPANKQTLALPINDLVKSDISMSEWESLAKSVTVQDDVPNFIEISNETRLINVTSNILDILDNIKELKKALSAGYPSGSPSGLVGGSVLMMPSIDKLYTSCEECGKRQVVLKNQVSCSHCGKSWTMDKIIKNLLS